MREDRKREIGWKSLKKRREKELHPKEANTSNYFEIGRNTWRGRCQILSCWKLFVFMRENKMKQPPGRNKNHSRTGQRFKRKSQPTVFHSLKIYREGTVFSLLLHSHSLTAMSLQKCFKFGWRNILQKHYIHFKLILKIMIYF